MRLEYISEANDLAKDAAAGLPELTGMAEEIAQAEYIRAELLDSAELFLRESWEQTNGSMTPPSKSITCRRCTSWGRYSCKCGLSPAPHGG